MSEVLWKTVCPVCEVIPSDENEVKRTGGVALCAAHRDTHGETYYKNLFAPRRPAFQPNVDRVWSPYPEPT